MTELELIEGCRRGNDFSRRRLYDLYSRRMMAICYRYTGNKFVSQDLLHDGFLKVFESIQSFQYRGEGSLRAWMSRIFTNLLLDYIKKQDTLNEAVPLEAWHEPDSIPDEEFAKTIPDEVLMQFITELPVGYRTIFNLYTFEEMPHKEIARLLNINESSSRSQLSRAKAILTEKLKSYLKKDE